MTTLPERDLFRPDEVADYFGVNVKTVYRWKDEGKLTAKKIGHKTIRITKESIIAIQKDDID